MNPKLIINLFKLRTNLDRLVDRCHAVGIKTAIVTKVFCADERICKMISESEADAFADSRVQNLAAIAELHSDKPTQLLRISMQSEVEDVVRYADISMQSEKETIRLIGGAAKELGKRNITVNAVAPGFIETPMTAVLDEKVKEAIKGQIALGRYGKPEEVASTISFLASEDASYISGQVIVIDGCLSM